MYIIKNYDKKKEMKIEIEKFSYKKITLIRI